MANNLAALKTEIFNVLLNTTNLDAATKQLVRDRFVAAYPGEFAKYLTDNAVADTPANRGKFVAFVTFDFWNNIFKSQDQKEKMAAITAVGMS
jgi:hypothetical protein